MFRNSIFTRNPLAAMFNRTLPSPAQPRDNEGRYLPHRIAVRRKAIELARKMDRPDLIARLSPASAFTDANGQTADSESRPPFIQVVR